MNMRIAGLELKRVARELQAIEFETEEQLKKYLKDHPGADRVMHTVKKQEKPKQEKQPAETRTHAAPASPPKGQKIYESAPDQGLEIQLTLDQAEILSTPDDRLEDAKALAQDPWIRQQLDAIDPEKLRQHLLDSGGWDEDELQDDETNKIRALWLAGNDIAENTDDSLVETTGDAPAGITESRPLPGASTVQPKYNTTDDGLLNIQLFTTDGFAFGTPAEGNPLIKPENKAEAEAILEKHLGEFDWSQSAINEAMSGPDREEKKAEMESAIRAARAELKKLGPDGDAPADTKAPSKPVTVRPKVTDSARPAMERSG